MTEASETLQQVLDGLDVRVDVSSTQHHPLRAADTVVVQEAFIAVAHKRFTTIEGLKLALGQRCSTLLR